MASLDAALARTHAGIHAVQQKVEQQQKAISERLSTIEKAILVIDQSLKNTAQHSNVYAGAVNVDPKSIENVLMDKLAKLLAAKVLLTTSLDESSSPQSKVLKDTEAAAKIALSCVASTFQRANGTTGAKKEEPPKSTNLTPSSSPSSQPSPQTSALHAQSQETRKKRTIEQQILDRIEILEMRLSIAVTGFDKQLLFAAHERLRVSLNESVDSRKCALEDTNCFFSPENRFFSSSSLH